MIQNRKGMHGYGWKFHKNFWAKLNIVQSSYPGKQMLVQILLLKKILMIFRVVVALSDFFWMFVTITFRAVFVSLLIAAR